MKAEPFKGTDTTSVHFSDETLALLTDTLGQDQLNVKGEAVELVAECDTIVAAATAGTPVTFSHDQLATLLGICRKTLFSKAVRVDAAALLKTIREGVESFYTE